MYSLQSFPYLIRLRKVSTSLALHQFHLCPPWTTSTSPLLLCSMERDPPGVLEHTLR